MQRLQEGQAFTCYLGHSDDSGFWSEGARFLDRSDWAGLKLAHGAGVFVTCGCFACQIDAAGREEHEGYGLAAIRNPAGPVAVIGASGESYAAAGQLAFTGLLGDLAGPSLPDRLGECFLHLKSGIAKGPMDFFTFTLFDHGDGSNGTVPLAVQRREHLEMWTLLGDPALHLPSVAPEISLEVPPPRLPVRQSPCAGRYRPDSTRRASASASSVLPAASLRICPLFLWNPVNRRDRALLANQVTANDPVLRIEQAVTCATVISASR